MLSVVVQKIAIRVIAAVKQIVACSSVAGQKLATAVIVDGRSDVRLIVRVRIFKIAWCNFVNGLCHFLLVPGRQRRAF